MTSVELLDHFLARIERDGPAVNAVVTLDAERARARAAEADAARARGESWGPLHGLPMTVKDAFETEGDRHHVGGARAPRPRARSGTPTPWPACAPPGR